jgi:hypothetical protein
MLGGAERPAPASPSEAPLGCFDSERSCNASTVRPMSAGSWGMVSVQLAPTIFEGALALEGMGKTSARHPTSLGGVSEGE